MAGAPVVLLDASQPGGTFVDDDESTHEGAIEAIALAGLTSGCDAVGPRYCPAQPVTRAQMATFLVNGFGVPASPLDAFADDNGSVHEPAINALAAAGITLGCDVAAYCPAGPVTRAQMAGFLARTMGLSIPDGIDTFTDDDGSLFEPAIEALAAAGLTSGCTAPELFCPSLPVTRAQMASFLARALDLELLTPPPRPPRVERLAADHAQLMTFGVRQAGTDAEAAALTWLAGELQAITGNVAEEQVPLSNGLTSGNVWATVGSGARNILLGAHVDSVAGSIGADDNGSGVAVLLEMARSLVADPLPAATVTFAFFGAEERLAGYGGDVHHAGSRHRAARLAETGELPDWMASVDMVGVGTDLLAVTYLSTSTAAADHLVAAGAQVGVTVQRQSRGDISDHEAFAEAGVPAVFMWRPDSPAWHTPSDTAVDLDLLVEDVTVVGVFLERIGG